MASPGILYLKNAIHKENNAKQGSRLILTKEAAIFAGSRLLLTTLGGMDIIFWNHLLVVMPFYKNIFHFPGITEAPSEGLQLLLFS